MLPNKTVMGNQNILNDHLTEVQNENLLLLEKVEGMLTLEDIALSIPLPGDNSVEITFGNLILIVAATLGGQTLLSAISSIPGVGSLIGTTNDEVVTAIESSIDNLYFGKPVIKPR